MVGDAGTQYCQAQVHQVPLEPPFQPPHAHLLQPCIPLGAPRPVPRLLPVLRLRICAPSAGSSPASLLLHWRQHRLRQLHSSLRQLCFRQRGVQHGSLQHAVAYGLLPLHGRLAAPLQAQDVSHNGAAAFSCLKLLVCTIS